MRLLWTVIIGFALILQCVACWAMYGVRISDLGNSPTPPNPMNVWGQVMSESPLVISDGRADIQVNGLSASVGDFVVVTGNWNAGVLTISPASGPYTGEMIYIPAGSFLMGNSGVGDDALYGEPAESPQHSVTLSAYYIGKCDVTRGDYAQFMNAGGYSTKSYWSSDGWNWKVSNNATGPQCWAAAQNWGTGSFTQTDSDPVVGVTYYEAEAFCNWAGGHLPTEAQWEMAARWNAAAHHPNIYPWGDTGAAENCNNYYDHNAAGGGYEMYQTSPVGSYPSGASPYGCQDMAGDVMQWVQDWYVSYPGCASPFDCTGSYRVLRGGGWGDYGSYLRCAYRYFDTPNDCNIDLGFRVAR